MFESESPRSSEEREAALGRRLAEVEMLLATSESRLGTTKTALAKVTEERDRLRHAYAHLKEQLELLRRRIYAAKAERIDAVQLEMEFAATQEKLEKLAAQLDEPSVAPEPPPTPPPAKTRAKPTGRRNLKDEEMPEERLELTNPALEGIVARLGFEESCRLAYRRGGPVRVVVARATYKEEDMPQENDREPSFRIVTAEKPKEIMERGLLAPSMIAHLLVSKYRFGLPFHRLSEMLRAQGVRLDDSVMCRYSEHVGATFGCIVDACAKEAKEKAFCLSTDATGVNIQPIPSRNGRRQACKKGHFFVVLADQDHIFFEYQPKHTSAAVCSMFRGFSGYIQADAHAIYDALYRGDASIEVGDKPPEEVGCWSHGRRPFWEAAVVAKDAAAREALLRIRKLFTLEEEWAGLAPKQRHDRRQLVSRPIVDDFFIWAREHYERVKGTRGLVAAAFGYAVRQEAALRRFLDDGRLPLTNNHSERALRNIATGRRSWFFFGSDDHASAAANHFSLIASCKLHDIDAETYLAEIIHVLPYWPRDRYLELAPKYWTATRARLRADEIAVEIGRITVPPPLDAPAEK